MGKLVNEKLESNGGVRVVEYGMGDDDKNLEEDYEQWKEEKVRMDGWTKANIDDMLSLT